MIYTLDYLKKESDYIATYWNGSDEKFIDGNGEPRTDEEAQVAIELGLKLAEVEAFIKELGI